MSDTIHEKLAAVQAALKAPKGQVNKFGGYKYRNCEDILQAAKPLTTSHGLVLTISDDIVEVAGRVYVKATATVSDGKDSIVTTAYAREEASKKGMDSSQLTGATSSYARKYALNGLFCIDDTKDADSADNTQHETKAVPIDDEQVARIEQQMAEYGVDAPAFMGWLKSSFGADQIADITTEQYPHILKVLDAKRKQQEAA
jgi:hypothetical protein